MDASNGRERPAFIEAISRAYSDRGKGVVVLTGGVNDLQWSGVLGGYAALEQVLYQEFHEKFLVLRMDAATGIQSYDPREEDELRVVCNFSDSAAKEGQKLGNVLEIIGQNRHSPLPSLVILEKLTTAFTKAKEGAKKIRSSGGDTSKVPQVRPICVIIQFSGSILPAGDFDRLSELDRQRLVQVLTWISNPLYANSPHLVILVSETKTELNSRIFATPVTEHVEIGLPATAERAHFVALSLKTQPQITFEGSEAEFVDATAGLNLTYVQDLLEAAQRTKQQVTRKQALEEVNRALQARLGDVIKVSSPTHRPDDIIGYAGTKEIFEVVFRQCNKVETAVSAIIVSGPNGGGKTYQLEAFAGASGRLVIELTGLRGMYYGQTDQFFELLKWQLLNFGGILVMVDEAHTAFGSVHKSDTHETEKRLGGNVIKMMSDKRFLGKVLWGMMTSRPDELDPDIRSRAPIQVPIFNLEGDEERGSFVRQMFKRRKIEIPDEELKVLLQRTDYYAARDYDNLLTQVAALGKPVLEVLDVWSASRSLDRPRLLQTLIAAENCSYPKLLPPSLKGKSDIDIHKEIEELKWELYGR